MKAPPTDGRQSPRALAIQRGVGRLLATQRATYLSEYALPNGQRADMFVLLPKGGIQIIEIKSSIEDFRSDKKWENYLEFCDEFFFATLPDVPQDIFPTQKGLLIADEFGAELLRPDETSSKMPAARRKSLTLRFAQLAGARLHHLFDPAIGEPQIF